MIALVGAALLALTFPKAATASLTLLFTFQGNGGYSADGLGQVGAVPPNTIQADVPAGSTVVKAFLYGTYFVLDPDLAERTIDFDGTFVELTKISDVGGFLSTARADVTAQVSAKVGNPAVPGGIYNFTIGNDPSSLDGVGLVVVFSNPVLPFATIAILDGSASQTGDTAFFTFAQPLDKTTPGFSATMTLGSGFSAQHQSGPAGLHTCGGDSNQSSLVDVNTMRLTSCAGNLDDGIGTVQGGILITVGGVGDLIDNPSNPFQEPGQGAVSEIVLDDELYNIEPFLNQGDTQLEITSSNPSQDDNLFLAVIKIAAQATVSQEDCDDGIDNDGDGLIDQADPDCQAPPPVSTPGKASGGGKISPDGALIEELATLLIKRTSSPLSFGSKATFGFVAQFDSGDPAPTGNLTYVDHAANIRIKALAYDTLVIDPTCMNATIKGMASVNGVMENLTVKVDDFEEPGSEPVSGPDTFTIITDTYSASGPLIGGNIQVRCQ